MKSLEGFIEIGEAANELHIATKTLYSWKAKGLVPFYKPGKKLLFRKSELIEFIESQRVMTEEELERKARQYRREQEAKMFRKVC